MQQISVILSMLGLAACITASMIKGEEIKKNLFFVFTGNILVGMSYLFTSLGLNGAVSSFIGGAQAITSYFFSAIKKPLPVWLIVVYALLFLCINLATLESAVGILAVLASLCFVGCVSAKSGKVYRLWQALNNVLWIGYDLLTFSYGPLATHSVLLVFTLLGSFINDRKKAN